MNVLGVAAALRALADALEAEAATPDSGDGLPPRDLSVGDVAEQFGRQPSTVRGWLERGALRGYRLNGKAWRIPPGAIAEFRAGQANGGATR